MHTSNQSAGANVHRTAQSALDRGDMRLAAALRIGGERPIDCSRSPRTPKSVRSGGQ